MANQVVIDVEARFIDNVSGNAKSASKAFDEVEKNAREAAKEVDNLGKAKADPKVDADTSKALDKLNKTEQKLSKIGKSKTDAKLGLLDKASAIIKKVAEKAKAFAGKSYSALLKIRDSNALSSLSNMSRKIKSISGKAWSVAVKVKDMATAPLRGIKNMLFSIKSLVVAITAGLAAKKLVLDPISTADAYSSAKIGFSTLLGESGGQAMMDSLDVFAKKTPFKTSGVIANAQKMMAMGWDTDTLIEDMEVIGNAAAATGKLDQGLESIVRAMSQIKTKGRLSTEELNQLAEAGIAAKAMLAENLGYGTGDEGIAAMTKDLEEGAIASDTAIAALLAGMKKYDGMMDSMANETVEGLKSQLEDAYEISIKRRWGQGLQDGMKRAIGSVVDLLDGAEDSLSAVGDMLYELGSKISSWVADKFENAIGRITEITDSYEFKNASLGEKFSMLWKGVIADPLKEWWEGGGQEKTAETAGKIGKWIGEMLTKGLLALFGATDILDKGIGKDQGASIAGSFLDGFLGAFDGSAITSAFVDAIGNVWNALPLWAKVLIGGYGIGKAAGGISSFAGGLTSFIGGVSGIIGSASKMTGLLGLGSSAAISLGAGNLAGGASLGAGALSMIGLAGIAGGLTGGASAIKGGYDLYKSYKAYKAGDQTEAKANAASGGTALGGVAAGAGIGAAVGSVIPGLGTAVGALIGAGIGGIAGWWGGSKWAKSIREDAAEAKFEIEGVGTAIENATTEEEKMQELSKAIWENMNRHMGDIKLSASEIKRLVDQIVWGEDLDKYEKFTSSAKMAENAFATLKSSAENTDRWMWKASLGVKFNDDEIESIKASFDQYINSAKNYVENKHYEFTAAVSLLVDVESEGGKSIIESGNAFYASMQEQLDSLGSSLSEKVNIALEDGVITLDEQAEIANLQQQIADITNKISQAESQAEIELIKIKFGNGNLDLDTFDSFMAQMSTTLSERISANDKAFKVSVANLNLQLSEGAISQEEYDSQLQTLIDGYTGKVESIKAEILGVELEIIGDAYEDVLGDDAVSKLQNALQQSLTDGIDPIEWTPEQARKYLGVDNLADDAALAIAQMLGGVADQLELVEVDGKLLLDLGIETDGDVESKIKETLPDTVNETVGVNISGEENIQNTIDILASDFGIPPEHAATVALLLTGDKKLLNKIDVSKLAKEFGIPESQAKNIIEKLTASKSIENRLEILASDFGIPDSISKKISVNLTAIKGKIQNFVGDIFGGGGDKGGKGGGFYRGGIVGGHNSMNAFARGGQTDNSGIVGGSTRFIRVNEEYPEMIIPLSSQRRERAMDLWTKTGELLGVPGFALGGSTNGGEDEGIRFENYGSGDHSSVGKSVYVEVGGITFEIHVDGSDPDSIIEAVREKAHEIADVVAGIINDDLSSQYENTPSRGGAA